MNNRANIEADIYWHRLNGVREITGNVTMTPAQFRKQLEQAVRFGFKRGYDFGSKASPEPKNPFCDIFRGLND